MKRYEKVILSNGSTGKVLKDLKRRLNLNYLTYINMTHAVGVHDMPVITCTSKVIPDYIALYTQPSDYHHTKHTAVSFFLYDDTFDGVEGLFNAIYYNLTDRLDFFRERFKGVRIFIMPDITQDGGVSDIENNHRLYRMRIISIWLTIEIGAVVIPFITFPTLRSFDFALDGYESCSMVAFSTKGCIDNPVEREALQEAVRLTTDRLHGLTDIVVFDVCQTNEKARDLFSYAHEQGISVHIPMNMLKSRNAARKAAKNAQL